MTTESKLPPKLQFYLPAGGALPLITMVAGILWLASMGMAASKPFWACGWLGLTVGLLFSKNRTDYCNALMRGIADYNGIVIIVAWIFASVLGKVMVAAGLVNGVLWLGLSTGVTGPTFTVVTFIAAMLFAAGSGTSNGTALALSPVLFPAGVFLGADPTAVALAILSGGAFGDNVAPISDTTIVSAYSQGATMRDVVATRFPLAITAAAIAAIALFAFGGSSQAVQDLPTLSSQADARSAWLFLPLAVVLVSALKNRHIIESLSYGIASAMILGLALGNLSLAQIFHVPDVRGESTGIIQNGVAGVTGPILFVVFVMGAVQIFRDSGLLRRFLDLCNRSFVHTIRGAEIMITAVSMAASALVTTNGAAILLVGPTLVRNLGERFHLSPARRANLMDCGVCSLFYMLPWSLGVLVWHSSIEDAADAYQLQAPPVTSSFLAPYPAALLLVLILSIATGWQRRFTQRNPKAEQNV